MLYRDVFSKKNLALFFNIFCNAKTRLFTMDTFIDVILIKKKIKKKLNL